MKQAGESPEKQLARTVGMQIANQRKVKGLTQAQLAEHMDIEKETVSRIETGVISPTLARLAQLAKFLDCEMGDLLKSGTPELADQAISLARRMENLSDSQRNILIQLFGKFATAMEKLNPKERKIVERFLSNIF